MLLFIFVLPSFVRVSELSKDGGTKYLGGRRFMRAAHYGRPGRPSHGPRAMLAHSLVTALPTHPKI